MADIVELWRKPKVLQVTGKKHAQLYKDIKDGLFVPPVKDGRSSHWPSTEVVSINGAKIAGRSREELKSLVASLVKQRQSVAA